MRRVLLTIICFVMVFVLASCSMEGFEKKETKDTKEAKETVITEASSQKSSLDQKTESVLKLDLISDKNALFSKYDMNVYFDGKMLKTIVNGEKYSTYLDVANGKHELRITKAEDESLECKEEIEITGDKTLVYEVSHGRNKIKIEIKETKDYVERINESDSEGEKEAEPKTEVETEKETEPETEAITETITEPELVTEKKTEVETEDNTPVYYSTNNLATAKLGNTGAFAYAKKGPEYTIYYIIDFDKGFTYQFVYGDGSDTCDRLKIESGDLNDKIIITYHDGDVQWSYGLHFKYKEHPDVLILEDNDHIEWEFRPTDYDKAVSIRNSLEMIDY